MMTRVKTLYTPEKTWRVTALTRCCGSKTTLQRGRIFFFPRTILRESVNNNWVCFSDRWQPREWCVHPIRCRKGLYNDARVKERTVSQLLYSVVENSCQATMGEICGLAVWASHFIPNTEITRCRAADILVSTRWTSGLKQSLRFTLATQNVNSPIGSSAWESGLYGDWLGGTQTSSTFTNVFALLFILTNCFFPPHFGTRCSNETNLREEVRNHVWREEAANRFTNSGGRQACGVRVVLWRWNIHMPWHHTSAALNWELFANRKVLPTVSFLCTRRHVRRKLRRVFTHFGMKTFQLSIKDARTFHVAIL